MMVQVALGFDCFVERITHVTNGYLNIAMCAFITIEI